MTHLVSLSDALGPIRDVYRHLLAPAVAWQQGRGRRTDVDHFALICVATDRNLCDATPTRWSRTDVYHVLRCDIPNWCSLHRCLWPAELPEALWDWTGWDWFDFLADTDRLDPASDPLAELRKPLQCYGGLDARGEPRPDDVPRAIPCECQLPYRETAELLNRLGLQCEQRGQYLLDVLRASVGEGPRHRGPDELDEMRAELRDDLRDIARGGLDGFPEVGPGWG
jgi:hypothetical protein